MYNEESNRASSFQPFKPQPPQLPFSAKMVSHPSPPIKVASKREREYLRPKEVEAMIKAAHSFGRHGVRDAAIILLMFRHGLRTAELVSMKWSQIDLNDGYIEIRRVKHGHDSTHPLRAPELRSLRQIKRDYPQTQYVFVSERKAPLSTRTNTARLRKIGSKTKRKEFAVYLREQLKLRDLLFLFEAIVQINPVLSKRINA